jgi:Phosphorylase superfamily
MNQANFIQTILVPQGAEHQAVCRGLSRIRTTANLPSILPIPVGPKPLVRYLEKLPQNRDLFKPLSQVLLMGLCGSLNPTYSVGDVVVYQNCIARIAQETDEIALNKSENLYQQKNCDRILTDQLYQRLQSQAALVNGLTSDRIVYAATQKRLLGQFYQADVVDMEGFAALEILNQIGIAAAMVRVVSDDSHHNIPNITTAIDFEGKLQPLPLALGFIRQPIAATRLIRGSLRGLKVLQEVTTVLFNSYS